MFKSIPARYESVLIKLAAAVLLIAAAWLSPWSRLQWLTYGLLAFGIANIFLELPGTLFIRKAAVAATSAVLIWQDVSVTLWATLLAWLIWPPAFMVAWALAP